LASISSDRWVGVELDDTWLGDCNCVKVPVTDGIARPEEVRRIRTLGLRIGVATGVRWTRYQPFCNWEG